jgi:urea transport system permease protein
MNEEHSLRTPVAESVPSADHVAFRSWVRLTEYGVAVLLGVGLLAFPLAATPFNMELMARFLLYGVFALSINLLWGYTGLLTLGHAFFFGLGAYAMGMGIKFREGLPEYMEADFREIPAILAWLNNPYVGLAVAVLLPLLCALAFGLLIFTGRVSGVYFSIITLALSLMLSNLFTKQQPYFGGFNGITNIPVPQMFGIVFDNFKLYYVILGYAVLTHLAAAWLRASHFGTVLSSIRENEQRTQSFSYNTPAFKTAILAIAALIAGLAGALFVSVNSYVSPPFVGIVFSIEAVVWVAVGGRRTLLGPMIGALLVNWLASLLSGGFAEYWLFFIGFLFLFVVLVFPDGLVGAFHRKFRSEGD